MNYYFIGIATVMRLQKACPLDKKLNKYKNSHT